MSHRPAANVLLELMEKVFPKNQKTRLCFLAAISVSFWIFLLYSHFLILRSSSGKDLVNLLDNSHVVNISFTPTHVSTPAHDTPPSHLPSPAIVSTPAPKTPPSHLPSPAIVSTPAPETPPSHRPSPANETTPSHLPSPANESTPAHASKRDTFKPVTYPFMKALRTVENKSDPCGGRYIYVHDLPSRFNEDMLKNCKSLSLWTDMCKFISNSGLGPPLENVEGVFSDTGWYATNQFAVDVIFSNRMKQYKCLTNDSSIAAAIFVPFYAGFDIARYLWGYNISTRDASSLDLVDWLMKRPEWGIMGGKDHFLVAGRITWDFRRLSDEETSWGNKLLLLPAGRNMSMLVIESSPWHSNDFGIPYPTYFHPAKDAEVFTWQDRMRKLERKWLFSFVGAPRPDKPESIRSQIINQCNNSKVCKLLECGFGEKSNCYSPSRIMQMFQNSFFCLQPQGDSYTRRSAFDSILAGCIPVFFHPGSAYIQYTWHLPKNYTTYSVLIPEDDIRRNVSIEERLSQISPEQVKIMRETVISLIPRIIYADPRSKLETIEDAFDVSVKAVIDKITRLRKNIVEGHTEYDNFKEEYSWKYVLLDEGQRGVGVHEWDPFFSIQKDEQKDDESSEAAKNSRKNEHRDQS